MHNANPDHAQHDTFLIAGHAAGDLSAAQVSAALALMTSCGDCAALHHDLAAISAAMRALPRETRAPRDFRLTAERAARLRRGSWLRTLLAPLASARSAARPMAAAFTSLGVAGLLVATFVPGMLGGMAALAPTQERDRFLGADQAPTSAPGFDSLDPLAGVPGPGATGDTGKANVDATGDPIEAAGGGGTRGEGNSGDGRNGAVDDLAVTSSPSLLLVGSLGFLVVGLAIFGLRLAARRIG